MSPETANLHSDAIDYDPLKSVVGRIVSRSVLLRKLFYLALGMLFLRQWHVRAELKRIARERRNKIKGIFDAGSGYGQYTYLMAKLFPQAHILAVDVKEEQLADGRWFSEKVGHKNVEYVLGDLTVFQRSESADLAVSADVMEHILEDEAVYRNVFATLRRGGRFIITTPTAETETIPGQSFHSVIGEHVREGYTEREFREKITRAGLVVEKLRRTYTPLWGSLAWHILQRIPVRLLTISKLFAIVVIPWMIVLYPFAALCMWLDVKSKGTKGGGWLMVAHKT
ncbi:class I SAM-dependent methyltransferase [bacterium]|nr:class I SAM-dependent methyltransferase [bacterium]MBU1984636.1 class I SAM-dependent methyltransferase [bacterium]